MDKYRKSHSEQPDEPTTENEMRITRNKRPANYINYASRTINETKTFIKIKAVGKTIQKAVFVAELLKRSISGLHQLTEFKSLERIEHYVPIEEGLDEVVVTQHVPCIIITLSLKPLDASHFGYQPPLPAELVSQFRDDGFYRGRGRRGSRRGGRGRGRGEDRRNSSRRDNTQARDPAEVKDSSQSKEYNTSRKQSGQYSNQNSGRRNTSDQVFRGKGMRVRTASRKNSKVQQDSTATKLTAPQKTTQPQTAPPQKTAAPQKTTQPQKSAPQKTTQPQKSAPQKTTQPQKSTAPQHK